MPDATGISHEAAAPRVGLVDRIRGKSAPVPEAPRPTAAKETDTRERSAFRSAGVAENIRTPEKKSLLSSSRQTFEVVVYREYSACNTVIEANKAALTPYITRLRSGQALTPADEAAIATAGGLSVDQLRFYVDFTTGNPKLDKPEAILAQSSAYLQRNDRLIAAEQMAERQLGIMQRAANADVVDYEVPAEETKFAEDAMIFDQEGHSATRDEALRHHRRWYQRGVFRTPGEKQGAKRADKRDEIKDKNAKKDQDIRYAGVRYKTVRGGKIETVAGGTINLHPAGAYEQALIGKTQLRGSEEMQGYARQITDIVHARVDFYVMTGMQRSDIRAQVWENTGVDNAGNVIYAHRGNTVDYLDVEMQHHGGADRAANFREQAKAQSEEIAKKTQASLEKARAEKKESDRKTALLEQINARIAELGKKSDSEQQADEKEKKRLEGERDKIKKELDMANKRKEAEKKKADAQEAIKKINQDTGVSTGPPAATDEVTDYSTSQEAVKSLQTQVSELRATLQHLEDEERKLLELARKYGKDTTTKKKDGSTETVHDDDATFKARALAVRVEPATGRTATTPETIDHAEAEIARLLADIKTEQAKQQAILTAHAAQGLTEAHIQNVLDNRKAIKAADAELDVVTTWETAQKVATPAFKLGTPEEIQQHIAQLEKQISEVGLERIQTQQAELLNTLKETIEGFEAIQQRLGQHQLGELTNIPDLPHLAGYPRVYLRTIQIMFGEDALSVAKQEDLKRYSRLLTPEKFFTLVGARFPGAHDMYDIAAATESTPANLELNMAQVDADMLKAIRSDLETSARSQTLGATDADLAIFDDIRLLRTQSPLDRTRLVGYVTPPAGLPPLVYVDSAGVAQTVIDAVTLTDYISQEAKRMYHYDNVQDLASRIIAEKGLNINDIDHQQAALFLAQEIERQRREHPAI